MHRPMASKGAHKLNCLVQTTGPGKEQGTLVSLIQEAIIYLVAAIIAVPLSKRLGFG